MRGLIWGITVNLLMWSGVVAAAADNHAPVTELGGKKLDEWIQEINSRDPGVKENAIRTVLLFGPAARKAVPNIIERLNDSDVSVRVNAAIALGVLGMDQRDFSQGVNKLAFALRDSQQIVRYQAALALSKIGPRARDAVQSLVSLLKDYSASWECRKAAALALGIVGIDEHGVDTRTLRNLTDALSQDPCAQVKLEAVSALFYIGPPTVSSIDVNSTKQAAYNLYNYRDKTVVLWAHMLIIRYENKVNESHLNVIAKLLKYPELGVRTQAARALGILGGNAKSKVPELTEALKDKEDLVVLWTIAALKEIGEPAKKALPDLKQLASVHKNPQIKQNANEAYNFISQAKPEVPAEGINPKRPDPKKGGKKPGGDDKAEK